MAGTTISIQVDEEAARAFAAASAEEQRKLQLLLNLRLRELTLNPSHSLRQIMDAIGTEAESRGLTPDKLAEILSEK